ncbi:MAG: phosphoserine phosphatase SerB [Muribaculaceae bacterium]|nr:phosphoserine phosphatase SerB [Muribaculaceae bacterium]MDE6007772.1 phosphoserine phosphatase SerB [Muribaculaceae bacterium]MDE6791839.1 phosphoserine phosphatase SerB [Muribaculaceae bacterium]
MSDNIITENPATSQDGKRELILINISGADKSGLTAALTEILARYDATVLDIGQADIHHTLSLGILFMTDSRKSGEIVKELLFTTNELKVQVSFQIVSEEEYNDWVSRQGKNRYIITILGRKITANQICATAKVISEQGLNIDAISRLTGRIPLEEGSQPATKACIEFSVRGTPIDQLQMKSDLMRLSRELNYDISMQEDTIYRRSRRLICFDMDSTLIRTEVIDELADRAGVGPEVRAITEAAMRGEIDFQESFKRRVALLKGLDVSVMKEIAENLPITEGVDRMMKVLNRSGYKTAILSGGFTYFGNYLKQKYNFDYVYANELEIGPDGKLTGRYLGDIVDGRRKKELLRLLAQVENIDIAQTIAVGDGANDLPMLSEAGLGIAFHAKPKVKAEAEQSISTIGIDGVLYFLGFKDSFISPSNPSVTVAVPEK